MKVISNWIGNKIATDVDQNMIYGKRKRPTKKEGRNGPSEDVGSVRLDAKAGEGMTIMALHTDRGGAEIPCWHAQRPQK